MIPNSIDPRRIIPAPNGLGSYTTNELLISLKTLSIDGSDPNELSAYAQEDCERFIQTVHLIPNQISSVLEIGANPYYITLLAKWFRTDLDLSLTNFFGGPVKAGVNKVEIIPPNGEKEEHEFTYDNVNVEEHTLPYPDNSFDAVLFCEVIEHLTRDPVKTLLEIWRVLKPEGYLILTTPNVARLENVARLLSGWNIYDPYSGYGPYGRHNREYTKHELHRMLSHIGFENDILITADVHINRAMEYYPNLAEVAHHIEFRSADLGQYLFSRWRKGGSVNSSRPSWLYRSLPDSELDFTPL